MATIQSTKRRTIAKRLCSSLLIAVVCAASSLLARVPAVAATGTWNGGAGATWDTTTTNWLNLSGTPWDLTNGGTNAAVFNSAAATPTISGTVWVNAITFANTATISGGVINLAGTAPTITTTANGTISSLLAGSSGLTKAGASTLTLSGSNTFTGTTSVTGGGLTLGGAAGSILGSSAVNVSAATFTLDNSSNNLNDRIADTATVTLNAASALAFTGNGATASTTEALGTLSLGGGQSTITLGGAGAGQLQTLSATSFSRSAGAVALVRGTNLQTQATNATRLTVGGTAGTGLSFVGAGTSSVGTSTAGTDKTLRIVPYLVGDTSQSGNGSTFLTYDTSPTAFGLRPLATGEYTTLTAGYTSAATAENVNNFNGTITTSSGVTVNSLRFNAAGALDGSGGGLTVNSGAILATASGTIGSGFSGLTLGNGTWNEGVITPTSGNTLTINAPITVTGNGGLTKGGAGTLVLGGSNTIAGGVTVQSGAIQVNNANALGSGALIFNVDADTTIPFNLPTSGTVANAITINKPGVNRTYQFQQNQSNNLTLAGNITTAAGNAVSFQLATGVSSGTFTLTGSNSFGADPGTGANVTLRFGGTNAAGVTSWRPNSTATFVLLDGAIFRGVFAPGTGVASFGMETSGTASVTGDFYTSGTTGIQTPAGAQLTFSGVVRSGGTYNKSGAGTWIMSNASNIQMTNNLLDGTLQIPTFAAIGGSSAASWLVLNGGTLRYTGAAASTAKEFTLGASGGGLDASGSGSAAFTSTSPVSFTGSGNRTLTLTGTNTGNNTLAMALNNNGADVVSLSKTGAGTWVLSGSNGYTGPTTVSAGSLVAGGTSAFGAQSGNITVSGGTLNLGNFGFTRTGTVSFTGGTTQSGTLTNNTVAYDAQAGTVSAVLAGSVGLSKTTSGTLTLSGSSTYTGMTTLSAGQLNVNSASAIGTGTFTISGGAIDNTSGSAVTLSTINAQAWNSDFAFVGSSALNLGTGAVTLGADRTATVTSSTLTVGGVVGGAFALTKAGAGTLSLTGANTYAGTTRITAGSLSIGNALALQNTTLDLNGADAGTVSAISQNSTLGGLTGSRNLDMLTRTLSIGNNNASTTYSGTLSNGALTKIGSGTLTLTASNAYAGTTTVSAGVLALSSAGSLASTGTVAITASGATFDISGANGNRTIGMLTGVAGSTVTLGANSLTFGDTTSGTFAGSIGGTGGLTKAGAGTVVLSASNSFSGGLTLTGGQVRIANANALGTGTFTTNVDADTTIAFNLPTSGTIANNITINKPGSNRTYYFQQNQSNNVTLPGNITVASGNGNQFTLNGVSTGTFTLTGSNTFGSDVYTSAGITFRIGGTNAAGSSPTVWRQDASTKMILFDGALFSRVINTVASYSMETSGSATMAADVYNKDTNTTVVDLPAGAQLTFASNIRAEGGNTTGTFTKTGAGTWIVNNTVNQMTFNILEGTMQVPSFSGIGPTSTASFLVLNGGTLRYTGATASTTREFTLGANGGSLDASGSGSAAFTSTAAVSFTGSGNRTLTLTGTNTGNNTLAMALNNNGADVVSLTKTGAGTWVLSGSNSYSGATTISSGVISFGNKNAFSATSGISIAGGAGLTYTGTADTLSTGITVTSGTGTVTNSGGQTLTLGGTLSKNGTVLRLTGGAFNVTGLITGTTAGASDLVVDAAAVTLSNTNTYNGPTYVYNSGTLSLGIDNAIPNTSAVYLGNNTTRGTLVLGSYTDSISQLLFSGSGGTVSLSGDKTASAQLATNGSLALGSNANLVLTSAGTSAGFYRLISFTSSSGSFASITGTSAAYQVITTSSSIDYQQRAVLGAVGVTNPAVSIITGGSAAFTYTVANSALSGGASLGFTSSSLSANLAGTSSGTAAAGGSSGAISGLVFTGTTVGSSQTGTFTVSAPTAYGATTATGTVTVNVLDHSNAALTLASGGGQTIITGGSFATVGFNLTNAGANRAAVQVNSLTNLTGATGSSVVLSGGTAGYSASILNTTSIGSGTLSVGMLAGDQQSLSGASALQSLTSSATYTVLDHALPGFLAPGITDPYTSGTLAINFGTVDESAGAQNFTYSLLNLASQTYGAGLTAGLDFTAVTANGDGFASGLSTFTNLLAGGTSSQFTFSFTPSARGTFSKQFTLSFYDNQSLSGASARRDLTISANVIVVPEPGTLALAGLGIGVAGLTAWRSRRAKRPGPLL